MKIPCRVSIAKLTRSIVSNLIQSFNQRELERDFHKICPSAHTNHITNLLVCCVYDSSDLNEIIFSHSSQYLDGGFWTSTTTNYTLRSHDYYPQWTVYATSSAHRDYSILFLSAALLCLWLSCSHPRTWFSINWINHLTISNSARESSSQASCSCRH